MGSQHVSLHWNGHKDNMVTMFEQLLSGEFLVDVTLESEGHHLKAHKIILSASSPFFQNLFVDNPCQHPTVVLTNIIKYENMKAIVDFVYQGKIDISRERLEEFLKSAERLKIKGLSTASQSETLIKNEANDHNADSLFSTLSRTNELQVPNIDETNLTFPVTAQQSVCSFENENSCQEIKIVKVEGSYEVAEQINKNNGSWEDMLSYSHLSSHRNWNSKTFPNSNVLQEIDLNDATVDKKSEGDLDPMQLSVKVELDNEVALNSMQVCVETDESASTEASDLMQGCTKVEDNYDISSPLEDPTDESDIQQMVSLLKSPTFYQEISTRNKKELASTGGKYATAIIGKPSTVRTLRPKCMKDSNIGTSKYSSSSNVETSIKKMSTPGLRFSCNTCGRMFKWRSHLAIHQMSHMNERPIYCDVCGGMFMRKTLLKLHMKIHGKQKVYSCVICGKSFLTETNLIIHNRTHTGEKPYDCNICGKKFTQKGNLAGHLRTHIGERPYICNVCNKRFTQNVGLRKHLFFTHCIKA